MGVEGAYASHGDYCMSMKIRTDTQLKDALVRAVQRARTEKELSSMVANVILGDVDSILIKVWSYLGDMGLVASQLKRIRAAVKKRIL